MPSINAAEVAWRMSKTPLLVEVVVGVVVILEGETELDGSLPDGRRDDDDLETVGLIEVDEDDEASPKSINTSHTRSWAGKGME